VSEDTDTLFEMMLAAERFCSEIESAAQDVAPSRETEELRLRLAQSRTFLREIRKLYDRGELTSHHALVRRNFRDLVIALMWVAFGARGFINVKLFRQLVLIESSLTYLLAPSEEGPG